MTNKNEKNGNQNIKMFISTTQYCIKLKKINLIGFHTFYFSFKKSIDYDNNFKINS